MVVAINKMDLPDATRLVKKQLSDEGLVRRRGRRYCGGGGSASRS